MELILKLNKKQLKIFSNLAQMLKIQHFVVSDEDEDEAFANAMQTGEQTLLSREEVVDFENWLEK